jgi:hypothetical protein
MTEFMIAVNIDGVFHRDITKDVDEAHMMGTSFNSVILGLKDMLFCTDVDMDYHVHYYVGYLIPNSIT